jgi:phosphate-selective porin OprO/OprP
MAGNRFRSSHLYALGLCALLSVNTGTSIAGENDMESLRSLLEQQSKRIEDQNKQLEELRQRLDAVASSSGGHISSADAMPQEDAVKKIVGDYLKEADKKKKEDEEKGKKKVEDEGFKVGSDLRMNVRWSPTNGVTFETPNKDFVSHIGYRFQLDNVYFTQSDNIRAATQVGDLQDGIFFRRSRPSWDGTAWEVMEWNCELALEQIQSGVPNFDECWVGLTKLPVIGTVRIGHNKVPQGFEGDQVSSSKAMTFLERSSYTDAFYENFATGLWLGNSVLDQRATWAFMAYRQDNPRTNSGIDFGDGEYGYTGRVTALPLYENDGRCLLHLGVSGTWRNNDRPDPGLADPRVARFRARPEIRDAFGDFGNGVLPGNSVRWVDTGAFASESTGIVGTEFFYVLGPFSAQAEYAWTFANAAVVGGNRVGTRAFDGGYVSLSYFLTGENRIYDRRLGRTGSTYISSPFTPFWTVRREEGGLSWGPGAWEVAVRWSHVDLNSGIIRGGVEDGLNLGLNWYLNNNMKIQFDYIHNNRYSLKAGQVPGDVDALGIRTQFFF